MEIKITIDAPGLEGAIHTLAQVLGNFEYPVNLPGTEEVSTLEPDNKVEEKSQVEEPKQEQTVSLETVRGKLAELAQNGKQKEVKALISELGADKLSDVPADKYPKLLELAEKIA